MTATECSPAGDNEVFLRGRLAAEPMMRQLPSGDELCTFRITVPRLSSENRDSRVRVDSIDCATVSGRVRRSVQRAAPGDQLEVTGSLHRRFWRSASGLGSRYEVLARSARVIKRPRSGA
jgi:single-strand DNA-binding protein